MVAKKEGATSGALLTRSQILDAKDIATEVVPVPEWGGSVKVRGFTGAARDELEARFTDDTGQMDREKYRLFRAWFAAHSIVDDKGARVFSEADIEALGDKSAIALQRVFDAASRLSAVDAETMDGITEDLKDDPNAGTGSA